METSVGKTTFHYYHDQSSVAFMFDSRKRTKVKNNKIQSWRLELAAFLYAIQYSQGRRTSVLTLYHIRFVVQFVLRICIACTTISVTQVLVAYYIMCVLKTCRFQ